MSPVESIADVADAVTAALDAAGLKCFRNRGPADPEAEAPYCIVYAQPPLLDGPGGDPHADATVTVQVKSVGNGPSSCERAGDAARAALLAGIVPPAGRGLSAPIYVSGGQPARPDEDTTVTVWQMDELYEIRTTPLSAA